MSSETLSHDEAIGQFCGVTGADEDRAKGLLEACDWNLELAINMHVDTDDGNRNSKPSTSNLAAGSSNSNHAGGSSTSNHNATINIPDSLDDDEEIIDADNRLPSRHVARRAGASTASTSPFLDIDEVRPPIPPVRQVLVQNPAAYSSDIAPRRYNSRTPGNTSDVYDAFRDFQAEAQWQEREMAHQQQEGESSSAESSDPTASTTESGNKRRGFADLFRPPLELMFRGSLISAREAGSLKNKWLLVNVQNSQEFACQTLNRDVWSNQAVKDIVKEHFVFWQVHHDSFEGTRYVQFYNVSSLPHVAIVDPRTGEQLRSWPTSIDHNSFCDSVIEFLTEHPSPDGSGDANTLKKLRVKEEDIARTLYDQSEEAQLEAAIKASLQETENSNSSSKAFVDEDSYTDAIESDNDQQPEVEDYKKYLGSDEEKFSELIVRFPDGTRNQFKFPSDSLMKALFLLLASRGYGMNQYNYVTTFPRRLLHELQATDTLQEAKLLRETIFVERKTEDH